MNTFYVNNSNFCDNYISITGDDFHHIKNVLRLKIGEQAYFCDEDADKFKAKLTEYTTSVAKFEVIEKVQDNAELSVNITLYQGLPKQEKMEFIVQKTTELGVKSIVPVIMSRSIVKLTQNDAIKKQERWQKIAKEASRAKW